jgi:pimeloyl-ACP methyl ester carboxylesterase
MSTVTSSDLVTVRTRRGIDNEVLVLGPPGAPPVVAFHGAGGHLAGEPMLVRLAEGFRVHAPLWPGYGTPGGEEQLEDMLDFALHGADVVAALGLGPEAGGPSPHVVAHSMGAMIAAEMVALAPSSYGRVALVAPAGLWLDEHPVPDIFAMLPFEFPQVLFHDPDAGAALMTGGLDFDDLEAIKAFLIANSRRLGTAGKILFPIPNRRLSRRLYRVTNPLLLVWGESDRLIAPAYALAWQALVAHAEVALVEEAGHMAPYEQPAAVAELVGAFLGRER